MRWGIIGAGWLGLPLAEFLLENDEEVLLTVTSEQKTAKLRGHGFDVLTWKLSPEKLPELGRLADCEVLVSTVPPSGLKRAYPELDLAYGKATERLAEALAGWKGKWIFCSSSGVLPKVPGSYSDSFLLSEANAAKKDIYLAEQAVGSHPGSLVIRLGGLMGYDRNPAKYFQGREVEAANLPVNYIHRDDAIRRLYEGRKAEGLWQAVAPQDCTKQAAIEQGLHFGTFKPPTKYLHSQGEARKIICSQALVGKDWLYRSAADFTYDKAAPLAG